MTICKITFALLGALLAGCATPLTEVLVVANTDLEVPAEIDRVRITVTSPRGEVRASEGPFTRRAELPATLGLVHRAGPLGDVQVLVEGLHGTSVVVTRRAAFAWIPNEIRVLRMDLLRGCAATTCAPTETCGENGCRPIHIAPEELLPYASFDAGAIDGGRVDAGPSDAGTRDAGTSDAGTSDAGTSDAGSDAGLPACTGLPALCGTGGSICACAGCACNPTCSSDCDFNCSRMSQCAIDGSGASTLAGRCANSTCAIDARGAQNVGLICANDARCEVDCTGASNCTVACRTSSRCVLYCTDASNCEMSDCTPTSCPGNVLVCNRACP